MKAEFVTYEAALALKELGFDDPCFGWFTNGYLRIGGIVENKHVQGDFEILAPLYHQAFAWFRDKYGIMYAVDKVGSTFYGSFTRINAGYESDYTDDYDTYEEVELACLKKLIEIVKTNKQ